MLWSVSALIYLLSAGAAGYLGTRSYREDPTDQVRKDFLFLATLCAIAYFAFSMYLAPGVPHMNLAFALAASFLPVATLQFLDHFFPSESLSNRNLIRQMWVLTPLLALAAVSVEFVFYRHTARPEWPLQSLGVVVYLFFFLVLSRLWKMHNHSTAPLQRSRIRYLLFLLAAAILPTLLEGAVRAWSEPVLLTNLDFNARSWALQGGLPPIGALCTILLLYSLSLVITLDRLLDLHEILARVATVAISGFLLVGIQAILVFWLGRTSTPLHQGYQLFMVGVLFVLIYEPVRDRVQPALTRALNRAGHQLTQAMFSLERVLPRVVSREDLARRVVTQLNSSGRFSALTLYVHDSDRQQMRVLDSRVVGDRLPLRSVVVSPFSDAFSRGVPAYIREDMVRVQGSSKMAEQVQARLRTMDAMQADIVIPLMSGELVLGWLGLRENPDTEGLSQDEINRLCRLIAQAAVVLENLHDFETLKEQHRLAALGTMAAGLAHEIRNPLAGIKGAAQFLQTVDDSEPGNEFLQVIISEVDRLNEVVQNFLYYARPFELNAETTEINATVSHVMSLVRAEGLPEGIRIEEHLAGNLPAFTLDGVKIGQVVMNLIRNAIQAMPEGTVRVSTSVGRMQGQLARGKPALIIRIEDNGPGIPKEDLDKLFIPFYTTKSDGTGLGLPICQRIVRAHEGEIEVRSMIDKGATFTVRLPLPKGI
jgi:two-component system sensor histidine kinase HydH